MLHLKLRESFVPKSDARWYLRTNVWYSYYIQAVERFDAVQDQHASAASEFEQAKEEAKDATHAFNEVKQKRHEAFMSCFEHISAELSAIYKVRSYSYSLTNVGTYRVPRAACRTHSEVTN